MSKFLFSKGNTIRRTHGHRKTANGETSSTYQSWRSMRSRCLNPNASDYHRYGGRGITICKRWDKFENFLEDMGERPKSLTLDRRNNDKGYSKSNCRWATKSEQQKNKNDYEYPFLHKNSRHIEFKGETKSISEWSRILNISLGLLRQRLSKWSVEQSFTQPIKEYK